MSLFLRPPGPARCQRGSAGAPRAQELTTWPFSLSLSLSLYRASGSSSVSLSLSLSFLRQGLRGLSGPLACVMGLLALSLSLSLSRSLLLLRQGCDAGVAPYSRSLSLSPLPLLLLRNIYPILTDLPASSASYLACRTTAARKTSGNMRSCVAVFVIHSPEQPDWDLNPDWPRDAKSFNSAEVHKDPLAVLVREDWPWL